MKDCKVESVSDFLNVIKSNREINSNDEANFLYRGIIKGNSFDLLPSIYRGNNIKNEAYFFNEIISTLPNDFTECKYTIEKLVKMQHYGVPTRLLDLTSNPLAALYFACRDDESEANNLSDEDGAVYLFKAKKEDIKYTESDSVSILANLCRQERVNLYIDYYISEALSEKIKFLCGQNIGLKKYIYKNFIFGRFINHKDFVTMKMELLDDYYRIKTNIDKFLNNKNLPNFHENMEKYINNISYSLRVQKDDLQMLLNDIRKEKPSFKDNVALLTLVQPIFFRPPWNNNRIFKQSGYFLLFGILDTKEECPTLNPNSYKKIIISNEAKKEIVKELDALDINYKTLFPEMPNIATYLKRKGIKQ